MEINRLTQLSEFKSLKEGDELIVTWNTNAEMWDKDMVGNKIYKILKIQKASTKSEYPDEIILRKKGNIFFNFRLFINEESKIVKEVNHIIHKEETNSANSQGISQGVKTSEGSLPTEGATHQAHNLEKRQQPSSDSFHKENAPNPENFDDGDTQVAPEGQFKAGKDIHTEIKGLMEKDYEEKECERIAKMIDTDNTFLNECENIIKKRFGKFAKENEGVKDVK